MELILVRHGLPERSADHSDPPLSPRGRAQAERVAAFLARETIDAVWSSTQRRAIETAAPLAAIARLDVLTHPGIREYDRDHSQYVPSEVLKGENRAAWLAQRTGEGVDLGAFQAEVVDAIERIVRDNAGRRVAIFCHGGVINVWTAHVLQIPARLFFDPTYASINRYSCSREGIRTIVSLNEFAHLGELARRDPKFTLPAAANDD
ncbi:MAG TPA: histidine phosphatase family protein [Candidatus Binataceae bacterium]|nr:histidine phosphatase family protein [Candidatus Binataceae bacterium]